MKMALYIALLAVLAGASYWLLSRDAEQERKELAMQYQRMQEANEKRQEEARQEERKEAERKDEAVRMLNAYLNREKQRLNKIVEECKIKMEAIDLDQKDLSDAIAEIEKENEKRAEVSRKRGIKRFDKAERVSLILKNPVMNAMAEKYTGEDLNTTYAKYKAHMSAAIKTQEDVAKGRRANRDEYYNSIKGLNEKVEEANIRARKRNDAVIREAEFNLRALKKKREPLELERVILVKQVSGMASPMHSKRIAELTEQIKLLDERITPAQLQLDTLKAQAAHMDATETETAVRKAENIAQDIRNEKDDDVINQARHEGRIYDIASSYENQTVDRIKDKMKTNYDMLWLTAVDAKKRLDYISRSVANIDLLRSDEIDKIRTKVVEELSKGLTADGDGAK